MNYPDQAAKHVYQAPTSVVGAFYALLSGWSVICVSLIESILEEWGSSGVFPLFMIGFILCYMWYFSLAISYRMEIGHDGNIRLKSLRRTIRTHAEGISVVEFPRLGLGFIRFRLEREKAYLLCLTINESLKNILSVIRDANPDINFKNL
ncbi:MAG: hypothetical protein PVI06_01600 [Desulfobacterales bacterium]